MASRDAVILYSGGTDSTCAAALLALNHERLHLLTFYESATKTSLSPESNIQRLRDKFGADRFIHHRMPIDPLLKHISYNRYWHYLPRYFFFMLATPGFSSLSWHTRAILYCLEHGIRKVADGLTRELTHFPGHMDSVITRVKDFYRSFEIEYTNPVRDWEVSENRQFMDQLVVDQHGFPFTSGEEEPTRRTTGRYLYEQGILPRPNVKGSALDRSMQQDCYPFVLYNIFAFWYYLPWHTYAQFEAIIVRLMNGKMMELQDDIQDFLQDPEKSRLGALIRGDSTHH